MFKENCDTYRFVTFHSHYRVSTKVHTAIPAKRTYPYRKSELSWQNKFCHGRRELFSTRHVTITVPQNRIILRRVQIEQYYVLIIIILSMAMLASGLSDICCLFSFIYVWVNTIFIPTMTIVVEFRTFFYF